jgi:hypothetical protein
LNRVRAGQAWRILLATAILAALVAFGRAAGLQSPWFAVTAAICPLGLLDLARFFVRLPVPRKALAIQPWETNGRVYRALGVRAFGEMLRRTPLRILNRRVYLDASSHDLKTICAHMEESEAAHLWAALLLIPCCLLAWRRGWWPTLVCLLLVELFANVYPILHLRCVRGRSERILQRRARTGVRDRLGARMRVTESPS